MKHNWEYKPFNLIADTITPRIKVEKSDYLQSGAIPIISQEESFISGYWNNLDDITPHNNDVVIFGDHSRVLKYVNCEFVVGADGVKIISPKKCIFPKFLYHFLKWYNVPSLGYSRHFKLVKEAFYPVPPREVQEQIVAELDKINEVIEDCHELLRTLDALAQSLFYDFFGDPVTNPKGWNVKSIQGIAKTTAGGTPSKTRTEYYTGGEILWLRSGEVCKMNITDTALRITELGLQNSSAKLVPVNSVVVAMYGATAAQVGIIRTEMALNQAICAILPNKYTNPIYLYFCLSALKDCLLKVAHGAAQPNISQAIIKTTPIPIPPLSLQEEFAERIELIEAQKKAVEETIAELQTLLSSRMDYWFN